MRSRNRRHIASHHDTPVHTLSKQQPATTDIPHPRSPILIHHNASIPEVTLQPNQIRGSPQHHNHRRTPSLTSHPHRPLQQILPTQPNQLFRRAKPRRTPRRQHHRRNPHRAHCACRYREAPPSLTCRATSSAVSRREAPKLPHTNRLGLRNHRQRNRLRPIPTQVQPHRRIDPLATLRHTSPNHRRRLAHQQ